jgi:hypothetical protein
MAVVTDVLFVAALGAGGAGFVLQQRARQQEVAVGLSPTSLTLSVRF